MGWDVLWFAALVAGVVCLLLFAFVTVRRFCLCVRRSRPIGEPCCEYASAFFQARISSQSIDAHSGEGENPLAAKPTRARTLLSTPALRLATL